MRHWTHRACEIALAVVVCACGRNERDAKLAPQDVVSILRRDVLDPMHTAAVRRLRELSEQELAELRGAVREDDLRLDGVGLLLARELHTRLAKGPSDIAAAMMLDMAGCADDLLVGFALRELRESKTGSVDKAVAEALLQRGTSKRRENAIWLAGARVKGGLEAINSIVAVLEDDHSHAERRAASVALASLVTDERGADALCGVLGDLGPAATREVIQQLARLGKYGVNRAMECLAEVARTASTDGQLRILKALDGVPDWDTGLQSVTEVMSSEGSAPEVREMAEQIAKRRRPPG